MNLPGYDAWLTTQPEPAELPLPGDPSWPRCSCGAFLRRDPDSVSSGELATRCDGQLHPDVSECGHVRAHRVHIYTVHTWSTLHRRCTRCGHANTEIEP